MQSETARLPGQPVLAHHFSTLEAQKSAASLGMWLFLATELLLFAGFFCCYTVYRFLFPETWEVAAGTLDWAMGAANTVVLITSSFTAALAVDFAKQGKNKVVAGLLGFTIACAAIFLVIKAFEWGHKIEVGTLPGIHFSNTDPALQLPAMPLFFTVYFGATGLHVVHVIIGATALSFMFVRALKKDFGPKHYVGLENVVLLWHVVDLVWIFLFPLLYFI